MENLPLPTINDLTREEKEKVDQWIRQLDTLVSQGVLPKDRPMLLTEVIAHLKEIDSLYWARVVVEFYNDLFLQQRASEKISIDLEMEAIDPEILKQQLTFDLELSSSVKTVMTVLKQGGSFPLSTILTVFGITDELNTGNVLKSKIKEFSQHDPKEELGWLVITQEKHIQLMKNHVSCQLCSGYVTVSQGKGFARCTSYQRAVCGDHLMDLVNTIGESPWCPTCQGSLRVYPVTCDGCGFDIIHPSHELTNATNDQATSEEQARCAYCNHSLPSNVMRFQQISTAHEASTPITKGLRINVEDEKARAGHK